MYTCPKPEARCTMQYAEGAGGEVRSVAFLQFDVKLAKRLRNTVVFGFLGLSNFLNFEIDVAVLNRSRRS